MHAVCYKVLKFSITSREQFCFFSRGEVEAVKWDVYDIKATYRPLFRELEEKNDVSGFFLITNYRRDSFDNYRRDSLDRNFQTYVPLVDNDREKAMIFSVKKRLIYQNINCT